MRLWHYKLIPHLPRQQLLGQHRECCALRGKGWGKKHKVVDYVFKNHYGTLFNYHCQIMDEINSREYKVNSLWRDANYRGKQIGIDYTAHNKYALKQYPEHNDEYLQECLDNLKGKGIEIKLEQNKSAM